MTQQLKVYWDECLVFRGETTNIEFFTSCFGKFTSSFFNSSYFSVLLNSFLLNTFLLTERNTWVLFGLRGSCRSSNRSMRGCTRRWGGAPPGRTRAAGGRAVQRKQRMDEEMRADPLKESPQTRVLTLSYQQRRLSCPHMQMLEEQSSLQTQYWGGDQQTHVTSSAFSFTRSHTKRNSLAGV